MDTIHITSNDNSLDCPIIYPDTIHITTTDHSFNCPIMYNDTIHITSNNHSFNCPIIYKDTIHITSNNTSLKCPIIYTDTIHITSNDRALGCLIIFMDIILNAILLIDPAAMFLYNETHSLGPIFPKYANVGILYFLVSSGTNFNFFYICHDPLDKWLMTKCI